MRVILIFALMFMIQVLNGQSQDFDRDYHPKWYPDGGKLVFYSYRNGGTGIYSLDIKGKNEKRIGSASGSHPIVSPDGKYIALCKRTSQSIRKIHILDVESGQLINVIDHPRKDLNAFHPTWTPDGRVLFNAEKKGESSILIANVNGSGIKTLVEGMIASTPTSYDDGKKIIFCARNGKEYYSIFTASIDGKNIKQITTDTASYAYPEVSPSGDKVVYGVRKNGKFKMYIMNLDGSKQQALNPGEWHDYFPRWSPDGKWIAFSTEMYGAPSIAIMNVKTKKIKQLSNFKK